MIPSEPQGRNTGWNQRLDILRQAAQKKFLDPLDASSDGKFVPSAV